MGYYLLSSIEVVLFSFTQSFKTRTGPAGWPGTRPTRAWDRPSRGQNPLRSWPGETQSTQWVDPGPGPPEWDPIYFFLILAVIKRRCFCLLKGQIAEEEQSNIGDSCKPNYRKRKSALWNPAKWFLVFLKS